MFCESGTRQKFLATMYKPYFWALYLPFKGSLRTPEEITLNAKLDEEDIAGRHLAGHLMALKGTVRNARTNEHKHDLSNIFAPSEVQWWRREENFVRTNLHFDRRAAPHADFHSPEERPR